MKALGALSGSLKAFFLFQSGNSGNNRLTRYGFKVKGRIPFTKRRHPL